MALKPDLSFAGGELDPVMHDRVTLEKFKKGLATARNVFVSKTGSLKSRFSRAHFLKAKEDDEVIKIYSPNNSGILTEWGDGYVRVYDFAGTLIGTVTSGAPNAAFLLNAHFVTSRKYIWLFSEGEDEVIFLYDDATPAFVNPNSDRINPPTFFTLAIGGVPTGYQVDYAVTKVVNGEESFLPVAQASVTYKLPLTALDSNTVTVTLNTSESYVITEYDSIKVYRRPAGGGAYGYIGSSSKIYDTAGVFKADFVDYGGAADFVNSYPRIVFKAGVGSTLQTRTGTVYQQRLLIASPAIDVEAIIASRPGLPHNFDRDFPYDSDSALEFKAGGEGRAKVLRMIENDGLVVFTTVGVYVSVGALSPTNLSLEKKGSWIIDVDVPPLSVPGGVFFVDKTTNTVRQLIYSERISTYETLDHTIFSEHLFKEKQINSWCFQGGIAPLIIVTFVDGTFATFTYHLEHQMRAWTRHDSRYPVEQVEGTNYADTSFFVINKDGDRYIEVSLPRSVTPSVRLANPEFDKLNFNAFMDGIETTQNLLNDSLTGSDVFLLALDAGDWEDELTLTCGTSGIFLVGTFGAIGAVMRFFDTSDGTAVDLTVTARTSDDEVTVQPSAEFPSAQASGFRLYETFAVIPDLDHLEGETVGIVSDGYVLASPSNDVEGYSDVTVSSGSITLPDDLRGAIVCVGRPITADIKTLNVSTVEQKPTIVESINVSKLYIRIYKTRGLYISNDFPEEKTGGVDGTSLVDMEDLDEFVGTEAEPILGNRYKQPQSRRLEVTLPGNWESNGQVSIRQSDPVHFEILSIIPDMEILWRRGRK